MLFRSLAGLSANILVLVDGPPGTIGPNARYPALPLLMQHLGQHRIDLLLDDYARDPEKQIADLWIGLLEERHLKYTKEEFEFARGALLLRIG